MRKESDKVQTNEIIAKIAKEMELQGVTQYALSKSLELSRSYVKRLFEYKHTPSMVVMIKILDHLGIKWNIQFTIKNI